MEVKQYCRYCSNAEDYNGEGTDFICLADAPCGGNGCGRFYSAAKAKRINHCKHFDFINADIFCDKNGNYKEYKPRPPYIEAKANYEANYEQTTLF